MEVLRSLAHRRDELTPSEVVAVKQLAFSLAVLILTPSALTAVPQNPATNPQDLSAGRLAVLAYDYVALPPGILDAAQKRASAIFRPTGIELSWLNCSPVGEPGHPICPESPLAPCVAVNLVHRLEDYSPWVARNVLGFSLIGGAHETSTISYVSPDRVKVLSGATNSSEGEVLGLAIAHEIGHLLLQQDGHTLRGLMRASWGTKDLQEAAALGFTQRQAKLLRSTLAERFRLFQRH
jgi:hypothetical protein